MQTRVCAIYARVAIKPQKLFSLDDVIPVALSREGEATAGANALMRLLFWNAMSRPGIHTRAARIIR